MFEPMKYGQAYFPHDTNASQDPKILALRSLYGWEGVGIFWATVEALHHTDGYLTRPLWGGHALAIGWPLEDFSQYVADCVTLDLFQLDDRGALCHHRVLETLDARRKAVESGRRGAGLRWGKDDQNRDPNRVPNGNPMESISIREGKEKRHNNGEVGPAAAGPGDLAAIDSRYRFQAVGGSVWSPTVDQVAKWSETFPGLDVDAVLRHAAAWVDAHKERRKTLRGYPKFVLAWLGRDNDSGKHRKGMSNGNTDRPGYSGPTVHDGRGAVRSLENVQQARNSRADRWGFNPDPDGGPNEGQGGVAG